MMHGTARRLQRSLRRLFKKRRSDALNAWWLSIVTSPTKWPEPARMFNQVIDAKARRLYFIRLTEEEATRQEELTDAIERHYAQERRDVL